MTLREIYIRFKKNYRNDNGGIVLYPQFDYDLDKLMEWLDKELGLKDVEVGCCWRPPYGEDD